MRDMTAVCGRWNCRAPELQNDRTRRAKKKSGTTMKVCVDQKRCRTYGRCVEICPEVFRFEPGSKKAVAVISEVPKHLQPCCREAAASCQACAILIDARSGQVS